MNVMDLRPRTNAHLIFQCDPSDMRRAIYNFGQIISDPNVKESSESFPLDFDDFEDGVSLAHKSVHKMPRISNAFSETASEPPSNSLNDWLSGLKPSKADSDPEGFEMIRNRLNSEDASSIEVISKADRENEYDFLEVLRLPMENWLQNSSNSHPLTIPQNLYPGLKRGNPKTDQVIERTMVYLTQQFAEQKLNEPAAKKTKIFNEDHFEFGKVIKGIVKSKSDEWLTTKKSPETSQSVSVDVSVVELCLNSF